MRHLLSGQNKSFPCPAAISPFIASCAGPCPSLRHSSRRPRRAVIRTVSRVRTNHRHCHTGGGQPDMTSMRRYWIRRRPPPTTAVCLTSARPSVHRSSFHLSTVHPPVCPPSTHPSVHRPPVRPSTVHHPVVCGQCPQSARPVRRQPAERAGRGGWYLGRGHVGPVAQSRGLAVIAPMAAIGPDGHIG